MAYGNYVVPVPLSDKFGTSGISALSNDYGSALPVNIGTDLNSHGYWDVASNTDNYLATGSGTTPRRVWTDMRFNFSNIQTREFLVTNTNNAHATFKNCEFRVVNPGGYNDIYDSDATSSLFVQNIRANGLASGYSNGVPGSSHSCNFQNCYIDLIQTAAATGNFDVMGDDLIDSTVSMANYGLGNSNVAAWSIRQDALIENTLFAGPTRYTFGAQTLLPQGILPGLLNFRGDPRGFNNVELDGVAMVLGTDYSTLLVAPNFANPNQAFFFSVNTTSAQGGSQGLVTVGPHIWALTGATNTATGGFATKIWWGGGNSNQSGQHFIQNYGTVRQSTSTIPNINNDTIERGAQGIYYYVSSNMPGILDSEGISGDSEFHNRFNTTTARTSPVTVRYKTDTDGYPRSEQYRLSETDTWKNGFINWTTLEVDTEVGASNFTTNAKNQSAGTNVLAFPVQAVRKDTDANLGVRYTVPAVANLYGRIDIRGYAYTNATDTETITQNTLTNNGSNLGPVPIDTDVRCNLRSYWVSPRNIVESDLASGASIIGPNARFPNNVTATNIKYNDIHDAARYFWAEFEADEVPVVSAGLATMNGLITGFSSEGNGVVGKGTDTEAIRLNTSDTEAIELGDLDHITGINVTNTWDLGEMRLVGGLVRAQTFRNPSVTTTAPSDAQFSEAAAFRNMAIGGAIEVNVPGSSPVYLTADNITRSGNTLTITRTGGTGQIRLVGFWPTSVTYPSSGDTEPVIQIGAPVVEVINDIDTEIHVGYGTYGVGATLPTYDTDSAHTVAVGATQTFHSTLFTNGQHVAFRMAAKGHNETARQDDNVIIDGNNLTTIRASEWLEGVAYNETVSFNDVTNNTVQVLTTNFIDSDIASFNSELSVPASIGFLNTAGTTRIVLTGADSDGITQSPAQITELSDEQTIRILMDLKGTRGAMYVRACVENRARNIVGAFDRFTPFIDTRYAILAPSFPSSYYVTGLVTASNDIIADAGASAVLTRSGSSYFIRNRQGGSGAATEADVREIVNAAESVLEALIRRTARQTQSKIDPLY